MRELETAGKRVEIPNDPIEQMKVMPNRELPSYVFHFTTDDSPTRNAVTETIAEYFSTLPDGQVDFFFNAANGRYFEK